MILEIYSNKIVARKLYFSLVPVLINNYTIQISVATAVCCLCYDYFVTDGSCLPSS